MRWLRREVDPRVAALLADAGVPGERLLAWGVLDDGQVVACTDWAILIPSGRVEWDLVVRGAWSEEFLDLVVQSAPGARAAHLRLRFDEPGQVPGVVRERVQWTVVASHRAILQHPDGREAGAMLNARRSPRTDDVRWGVVFDSGVDPADPGWRSAADDSLADLQDRLGT